MKEDNKAQKENNIDNQQNSTTKLDDKNIILMKNKEIYLTEMITMDECSKCDEEECEIIYKFNNNLEIYWYDCEPDDEKFNELVKLDIFENNFHFK